MTQKCLDCGAESDYGRRQCPACAATQADRVVTTWWEPDPPQPDLLMGSGALDAADVVERVRAALAPKRTPGSQRWTAKR